MSSISISFLMFELWLLRFSSFLDVLWVPLFLYDAWSHITFFGAVLLKMQRRAHRQQISCLWGSHEAKTLSSFFFCQRGMSSSNAFCRIVSNSMLDRRSPCLVPFLTSNMSLSSSVSTVAFWSPYNCSGGGCNHVRYRNIWGRPKLMWVIDSNAFVKSIVAAHILIHHSWHLWSIILYVARWSVVW